MYRRERTGKYCNTNAAAAFSAFFALSLMLSSEISVEAARPAQKPGSTKKSGTPVSNNSSRAGVKAGAHTSSVNPKPCADRKADSNAGGVPDSVICRMKEEAYELQKNGKLEQAEELLTKVSKARPSDEAVLEDLCSLHLQKARDSLNANKFDSALLSVRQALAASPNNREANQILSQLYKKVGADPQNVECRLKTADALYNQGRYQEAEVEYQASLAIKLTAQAYVGLGRVAEKLEEPGAGREEFERALEIDPQCPAAHREMGHCYLVNGNVVSANSELSRALITNPQDREAGASLVKLWQDQVARMPDANSHLGLARAYQLQGQLAAAQAEYKEVVRLDPKNPALPAARQSFKIALARSEAARNISEARALEAQGHLQDAYKRACVAVGYSPENSAYMFYQGELLEKLGQPLMARQVYLRVLEFDPQNTLAVARIKQLPLPGVIPPPAGDNYYRAAALNRQAMPQASFRSTRGFPGSKFPWSEGQGTAASGTAAPGTAASLGSQQVDSLSSFIGQLRDQCMLARKGPSGPGVAGARAASAAAGLSGGLTASSGAAAQFQAQPLATTGSAANANAPTGDDFLTKMLVQPIPENSISAAGAASTAANNTGSSTAWAHANKPNSRPAAKKKLSVSERVKELERQNKKLQDEIYQLNESAGDIAPSHSTLAPTAKAPRKAVTPAPAKQKAPVNAGGLFAGSFTDYSN